MKYAVIISKADPASVNIFESLKRLYDFKRHSDSLYVKDNIEIHIVEKESIYNENLDEKIKADYIIFATRHQSSGRKSLTCHIPGNFNKAEFGGKDKELCIAPASLMKELFLNLKKNALDLEVSLEITHHGPLLKKTPCLFIEIGSNKDHWSDKQAGDIIAKTILDTLTNMIREFPVIICFGGNHYCAPFNRLELESEYALSHICPSHTLEFLDSNLLKQMLSRTDSKVSFAILDWKGMSSSHKQKVLKLLEENNIQWKKTKDIK